jgi:hypothetical protein
LWLLFEERAIVDLPVRGLDLALQRCALVRRGSFGELFMQGEHSFHQGDHSVVAGGILWAVKSISSIKDLSFPEHL